tara:strand:+ start:3043 stop:3312 length:270 start_codon:yes stop_codon:yes gene_type:complete
MTMNNLINRRAVRKLALVIANEMHPQKTMSDEYVDASGRTWNYGRALASSANKKYKQVSISFLEHINGMVRVEVEKYIKKNPPRGATVK